MSEQSWPATSPLDAILEATDVEKSAPAGTTPTDELGMRRLLLTLARIDRETERLKALKAAVAEPYDRKLRQLAATRERARESVREYLTRLPEGEQRISFPDVGRTHLRPYDAKLRVADSDTFEVFCGEALDPQN